MHLKTDADKYVMQQQLLLIIYLCQSQYAVIASQLETGVTAHSFISTHF